MDQKVANALLEQMKEKHSCEIDFDTEPIKSSTNCENSTQTGKNETSGEMILEEQNKRIESECTGSEDEFEILEFHTA